MRTRSLVISATLISALMLALAVIVIAADDPHIGIWKLNLVKSSYSPGPAPRSAMVNVEAQDNGVKLMEDTVDAEGKASHAEFTAHFDGKDYTLVGNPDVDTVSFKKPDANTWDEVSKKAGKEVLKSQNIISKDGKTMTRTVRGKNAKGQDINNTIVYDKQ